MAGQLWCDKHRPDSLDGLTYHDELSVRLRKLASAGEFPHLLFYGCSGAGKKTRINCLLRELYGPGALRVRTSTKPYKVSKTRTIDLTVLSSQYHIEMNPADAGIYDRIIVQEVLKNMASVHSMNSKSKRKFKVVLLEEVDHLTKNAQHALRRTMEKYMTNCRLILCCESVSKVIDPLRSRCLAIRVPAPQKTEIAQCLQTVAQKEDFEITESLALQIAHKSKRNLRRAILMLQIARAENEELNENTEIKDYPWETFITDICDSILREQRPAVLNLARQKIYELTVNLIPPTTIIRVMSERLMENVDDQLKHKIIYWAAYHEGRMQIGDRPEVHITAFMARFMQIYKQWSDAWFM